jgi:hypothetical protein
MVAEHRHPVMQAHHRSRQAIFDRITALRDAGKTAHDIAKETRFNRRTINKWLRLEVPSRSFLNAAQHRM